MVKVQIISFTMNFVVIMSNVITYAIIARILLSWFQMGNPEGAHGRISQLIYDITNPFINLARRLPHRIGMFDLSALIALLAVDLIGRLVIVLLQRL